MLFTFLNCHIYKLVVILSREMAEHLQSTNGTSLLNGAAPNGVLLSPVVTPAVAAPVAASVQPISAGELWTFGLWYRLVNATMQMR